MPLLDHFRPPLHPGRNWETMHFAWANSIMAHLNQNLPTGYFAATQLHLGSRIEVDVATLETEERGSARGNGAVGLATEVWSPPAPPLIMPAFFPDEVEIQVIGGRAGAHLVAAVELVSPGNKDRPEARRAFAVKCASYLQIGVGLVVVDVVSDRLANLHDELIELLDQETSNQFADGAALYGVAYRPIRREVEGDQIEMWPYALAIGETLPVVPLALLSGPTLPLDLEATYSEARVRSRL